MMAKSFEQFMEDKDLEFICMLKRPRVIKALLEIIKDSEQEEESDGPG